MLDGSTARILQAARAESWVGARARANSVNTVRRSEHPVAFFENYMFQSECRYIDLPSFNQHRAEVSYFGSCLAPRRASLRGKSCVLLPVRLLLACPMGDGGTESMASRIARSRMARRTPTAETLPPPFSMTAAAAAEKAERQEIAAAKARERALLEETKTRPRTPRTPRTPRDGNAGVERASSPGVRKIKTGIKLQLDEVTRKASVENELHEKKLRAQQEALERRALAARRAEKAIKLQSGARGLLARNVARHIRLPPLEKFAK